MQDKGLEPYKTEENKMEKGTFQLLGRVGKTLERKTNLTDVKIYKARYVSSRDDRGQAGLSPAQNEEVKVPLSAAVLTGAPQQGKTTRHPANPTHEQTRDCVPSSCFTSVQAVCL